MENETKNFDEVEVLNDPQPEENLSFDSPSNENLSNVEPQQDAVVADETIATDEPDQNEEPVQEDTAEEQSLQEDAVEEPKEDFQPVEEDATGEDPEDTFHNEKFVQEEPVKRDLPVVDDDSDDDIVALRQTENPNQYRNEDEVSQYFEEVNKENLPKKKKKKKKKVKMQLDPSVQPVKAGKLFIAELLVGIPIIGIIFAFIFVLNKKTNKNVKTYAKLSFIWQIIGIALFAFFLATDGFGYLIGWLFDFLGIQGIKF